MTTIAWFVALAAVAIVAGWQGYLVGHDNGHASGSKEGYEEGSMSIKTWAVTAGVAEFYLDKHHERRWRWIPASPSQESA